MLPGEKKERELPEGWWKTVDQNSGKVYYYTADGKKQWNFPGDAEPDSDSECDSEEEEKKDSLDDGEPISNNYERSIITCIMNFLFFPFLSILKTAIWVMIQGIFIIFEVVIGFVCLQGQAETSYYKLLTSEAPDFIITENSRVIAFLPVFLIVDGFVWLVEMVLHYLLMGTGAANYLLQNPPLFETSFSALFDSAHRAQYILFSINAVVFCVVRVFQLVWSVIAGFRFGLMALVPERSWAETNLLERPDIEGYYRLCDLLRGTAVAFIAVNFISLTLWSFVIAILMHLRVNGKRLVTKKS